MIKDLKLINKYFPKISEKQLQLFDMLVQEHKEFSNRLNLISRKDIDNIVSRHVLHSLSILKLINIPPGTRLVDVGSGGGFPGIPLAIMLPECNFTLIDSIKKKTDALTQITQNLTLPNVRIIRSRAEDHSDMYDIILGRAVSSIPNFLKLVKGLLDIRSSNIITGILYLKGGDFEEELKNTSCENIIYSLKGLYEDSFYDTKSLIHIKRM